MIKVTITAALITYYLTQDEQVGLFKITKGLPSFCTLQDIKYNTKKGTAELFFSRNHPICSEVNDQDREINLTIEAIPVNG